MDLSNKVEAQAAFLDIISKNPQLENLADGQVIHGINTFQNLALEYALHRVERATQEGYISTALNRSSILSLAEDRQYLPRKAMPSTGKVLIRNKLEKDKSVLSHYALVSDEQVYYMTTDSIIVPAGGEVEVGIQQLKKHELHFTIEVEKAFIEYQFGKKLSAKLHDFDVYVDENDGFGYEKWQPTKRFRNVRDDKVFDEFYSHTDQVGIRFGNGIFGSIPKQKAKVRIDLWLTEGDTRLLPNQTLTPISDEEHLEFETISNISGGTERESTEELRRNALYYPLYDENHTWDDDYLFFIKRNFPAVIWARVWGEEEQEQMDGELKYENVNSIFVCAYAPGLENASELIAQYMQKNIPQFNRSYKAVAVDERSFVVKIEARLKRNITMNDAKTMINKILVEHYGKDTERRKLKALKKDLYKIMNMLGIFESEDDIFIEIQGESEPGNLKQMVFIDIESTMSSLNLDYTSQTNISIY